MRPGQEVTCQKMGNQGGEGLDMEKAGEREDARTCGKTQANRKRQRWKTQDLFGKVNKSFISKWSIIEACEYIPYIPNNKKRLCQVFPHIAAKPLEVSNKIKASVRI